MTDPLKIRYMIGSTLESDDESYDKLIVEPEPFFDNEEELFAFLDALYNAGHHKKADFAKRACWSHHREDKSFK